MELHTPDQLAQEGKDAYQAGEVLRAADLFNAAAEGYSAQGDTLMAAEMANNRGVALLQANEAQAALDAVSGTDKVFEEVGDRLRLAMALGNQGAALDALKRLDEAERAYLRSAELLKELGEHDLRAPVMKSLSALQMRTGRQLEALATMQAGVEGMERPNLRQRILKKLLRIPFKLFNRS